MRQLSPPLPRPEFQVSLDDGYGPTVCAVSVRYGRRVRPVPRRRCYREQRERTSIRQLTPERTTLDRLAPTGSGARSRTGRAVARRPDAVLLLFVRSRIRGGEPRASAECPERARRRASSLGEKVRPVNSIDITDEEFARAPAVEGRGPLPRLQGDGDLAREAHAVARGLLQRRRRRSICGDSRDRRASVWSGFQDEEDANGHLQAFEQVSPFGEDLDGEFLRCPSQSGLVLHVNARNLDSSGQRQTTRSSRGCPPATLR